MHVAFNGGVAVTSGWFPIYMLADAVLWLDVMARFATPVWSDDHAQQLSRRRVEVGYLRAELVPDLLIRFPWDAALTHVRGRPWLVSGGGIFKLALPGRALFSCVPRVIFLKVVSGTVGIISLSTMTSSAVPHDSGCSTAWPARAMTSGTMRS